jgi:hypothetical protein
LLDDDAKRMEGDTPPLHHFSIQLQAYADTKNNPKVTHEKKKIVTQFYKIYKMYVPYRAHASLVQGHQEVFVHLMITIQKEVHRDLSITLYIGCITFFFLSTWFEA